VAPGKEEGAWAHWNGGSMARWRKRRRAAVFNGGVVAPVVVDEGGWVLQLEGDPEVRRGRSIEGKSSSEGRSPEGGGRRRRHSNGVQRGGGGVRGARAWTGYTNNARGRKIQPASGGLVLRGATGRGVQRGLTAGTPCSVGCVGPGSDRRAASRPPPGRPRRTFVSPVARRRS
jgi:hypothetical protein